MMIIIIAFVALTTPFIIKENEFFNSSTATSILLLRFSLLSALSLMIYLFLDLIYSQQEKIDLLIENANLRYNNLENDYKLLKAQINPHFLFNALNISKSMIKTQPKNAERFIIQLSEFLRNSLNKNQKSISLKEELAHVQQYVELQKVRFENTFEYSIDVDNIHLVKKLPPFSLTTLVENALKHNSFSEEAPLNISARVVDGFLEVKNNMKSKVGVVSTHTGLSNLSQRSKMLSGSDLIIENDNHFFIVKIKLIENELCYN